MINKEQYLAAMRHEANVCQHLFGKIPEGTWNYRPTEGQRSTIELLRYLPHNLGSIPETVVSGDWKGIGPKMQRTKEMPADAFCAEIDAQYDRLVKLFAGLSEDDFQTRQATMPDGRTMALGPALLMFGLSFMTAYKMQLFLYIKSNGVPNMGTADCWRGVDTQPKK
ncbi:MAG: hypothetical protein AMXMBFR7_38260 [Planctomycetota bacterium]